jgi:putative DNA primase/helicase
MSALRHSDQARALLHHARSASLFCSDDGEPCASVPAINESRHIHPLRSAAFRDWLIADFYTQYETAPSPDALRSALRTLEARARYGEWKPQTVDQRLGFEGDPFMPSKIILNLANPSGDLLEITSQGWQITDNLHHSFRQPVAALALPRPVQAQDAAANPLDTFAKLFPFSEGDRVRVFTWLISALRPVGPYPVLVIRGPAASGKSFLARTLRALIDPSAAPLRRLPHRDHELLRLAFQNWILAFDQVHQVPSKIAEALCALSSGDAFEITQPDYRDPLSFQLARPIALIAPTDETQPAWTPSRSLSNRTLAINMTPLAKMTPEAALWSEFEVMRPALLAALSDAIASALHNIRDVDVSNVTRFSDCANWTAAAAPALGLTEQSIVDAISDPDGVWIGADPLRDTLHAFLPPDSTWIGDATTLLSQLRTFAPFAILPSTPKDLSAYLAGIAGIQFQRSKGSDGLRTITIKRTSLRKSHHQTQTPGSAPLI